MDRMTPEDGTSPDIVAKNIDKLRAIFPEVFADGRIDFDSLKQTLGDYVDDREERYSFTWHGKSKARQIAQMPSSGTLRPCPEDSVDWDTTKNIFIEGDNLEVLKLLQKSYHRKVKMIYIDPPYNTGKEFIYPDKWQDNLDTYLRYTGQVDDDGLKLSANSETSGRFHTKWLNMMYPRLKLARNLLRDDGVIFVSIDDHEAHNLRHLMDEIFGPENFVIDLVWKHTEQGKHDEPYFARHHNQILAYRKSSELPRIRRPRTEADNRNYSNPDGDPRGMWRSGDVRSPSLRPTLRYDIATPSGGVLTPPEKGWRWSEATLLSKINEGEIVFSDDESRIIRKIYLANQEGRVPESIIEGKVHGDTRLATRELRARIGESPFDTPKPTGLIKYLATLTTSEGDTVLDFFAGSGTTGDALLEMNAVEAKSRRFILVQLPEPIDDAEYSTICDITRSRLRAASDALLQDRGDSLSGTGSAACDLGFRVFKLASSNLQPWDAEFETMEQNLLDAVDNVKADRSESDVLYELLLKYGLDLAIPAETRTIAGRAVSVIGAGALVVCLASDITLDVVQGIAAIKDELEPEVMRVVFKDSGFADDVVKTNAAHILRRAGIDDVKSL